MSVTIRAGGLVTLDPSDKRVIVFDWDTEALESSVQIASSSWTITGIPATVTSLVKDSESLVTGNRSTKVRLDATATTAGQRYRVANAIVTNENPAQTIERQFTVLIQNQ